MKTLAVLDENKVVINIITAENDSYENDRRIVYTDANPAYIGGDYVDGFFYPPKPFPSWIRNKGEWLCPVPYPTEEGRWQWNEEDQKWEA